MSAPRKRFIDMLAFAGLLALAGCADISADIAVLDADTARMTLVYVTDAQTAATLDEAAMDGEATQFCEDGEVTRHGDQVTCTQIKQGTLAELNADPDDGFVIEALGQGEVRVSFESALLTQQVGEDDGSGMRAMFADMFAGRRIAISIGGGTIVGTNLPDVTPTSASVNLPIDGLIRGTVVLPDEYFAVVRR